MRDVEAGGQGKRVARRLRALAKTGAGIAREKAQAKAGSRKSATAAASSPSDQRSGALPYPARGHDARTWPPLRAATQTRAGRCPRNHAATLVSQHLYYRCLREATYASDHTHAVPAAPHPKRVILPFCWLRSRPNRDEVLSRKATEASVSAAAYRSEWARPTTPCSTAYEDTRKSGSSRTRASPAPRYAGQTPAVVLYASAADRVASVVRAPTGHRGAGGRNRTVDLLFTRQLLCQLSYAGPAGSLAQDRGLPNVLPQRNRAPPETGPETQRAPRGGGARWQGLGLPLRGVDKEYRPQRIKRVLSEP